MEKKRQMAPSDKIGAIVLAAGQSRRMGSPKMTLPWGNTTVLGRVVMVLLEAGISNILVVTGGHLCAVLRALKEYPVQTVHNSEFATTEMLESLQCGLAEMQGTARAALVVLGDQPQIEVDTVVKIVERYHAGNAALVVPSYQMRRGHPWLVGSPLWPELLQMARGRSLREFLTRHAASIDYIEVSNSSILQDLDTPADYQQATAKD